MAPSPVRTDGSSAVRYRHVRIDPIKLEKAKVILDARTDSDAIDRALDVVLREPPIDAALRHVRGRGKLNSSRKGATIPAESTFRTG
jgi:hypothetical protein